MVRGWGPSDPASRLDTMQSDSYRYAAPMLRERRVASGLSSRAVADACDVSKSYLLNVERGLQRASPELQLALVGVLKGSVMEELFGPTNPLPSMSRTRQLRNQAARDRKRIAAEAVVDESELVSMGEAQRMTGVSRTTLRVWLRLGHIEAKGYGANKAVFLSLTEIKEASRARAEVQRKNLAQVHER